MATGTRVAIIGAGNVASALLTALSRGGANVVQVVSRNAMHARELAEPFGVAWGGLDDVTLRADVYIISVADDAIAEVSQAVPADVKGIVAHTSGSVSSEVLSRFHHYGVFYPLQTFSRGIEVDFSEITIYTHGSDAPTLDHLDRLASLLTPHVVHADDRRRGVLHLAAVWACNFSNYMWMKSEEILAPEGLALDTFAPLIRATLAKALECGAHAGQTGPARRGDDEVMRRHISMLPKAEAELYAALSQRITETYHNTPTHEQD